MAIAPILALTDIRLTLGSQLLLEAAALTVMPGDRIALVGRNGSGKSTLLRIASGQVEADGGIRFLQPGTTVRTLDQEPDLSGFSTVLAYVEAGLGPTDDAHRALYLLNELGLVGDEHPSRLSGGEARRAALARVLAPEPDILLLDEPTNHLDLPVIEWLEAELKSRRSAIVLISHDRRFLSGLTQATVWLDRGLTRRLDRGFGAFEAWRDTVLEEEEQARHKLDRQVVREEHWLRYGVTARRKRNVRRLEGLNSLRREVRDQKRTTGDVRLTVSEGKTPGAMIVEADRISKAFGETRVIEDFSTRIMRGARLGVIGRNGAGKTTLLKLLTGVLQPDSGTIRLGSNLQIASLDQGRTTLKPDMTLKDALTGGGSDTVIVNGVARHVVGYMQDFLFTPEQARTVVGKLSGGERARVTLARALALPSNVLVLDEPTNDLDLETLDLLEELVADYPGTVIVVSHDRDFLDRVSSSVVMSEGQGRWVEYAGGYTDMLAQRGAGVTAVSAVSAGKTRAEKQASSSGPAPQRNKLNFKQKHALETLPKTLAALQAEIASLNVKLADPKLYTSDPNAFAKLSTALGDATAKHAAAEEAWLELEILREEIEG